MFDQLKRRYQKLSDKGNRKTVAEVFRNPEYIQDSSEREAQIYFYKLLMIAAYSDGEVDDNEIELIKNYLFEECITEDEWREIDVFSRRKASREEIEKIYDSLLEKVSLNSARKDILAAVHKIVESDGVLKPQERELLTLLEKRSSPGGGLFKSLTGRLKSLTDAGSGKGSGQAAYDVRNPLYSVLRPYLKGSTETEVSKAAAKIGLMVIVAYSDMELHPDEIIALKSLVSTLCGTGAVDTAAIMEKINSVPDNYYEIAYLCRILTDSAAQEERIALLEDLFKIARADGVYDAIEDKYLKIISSSLFISHDDFIKVKLAKN